MDQDMQAQPKQTQQKETNPARVSFSYKPFRYESANHAVRPEGLGALMRRVLDLKGGPYMGPPLFYAVRAAS